MDGLDSIHTEERTLDCFPHDILVEIHNKLPFADQVRFRAVCKNFRIPRKVIRCSDRFPWAMNLTWMNPALVPDIYPFECQLFDPSSQKLCHRTWNFLREYEDLSDGFQERRSFASKYGWLLLGLLGKFSILFLHNPFSNEVIRLPHLNLSCKAATFTTYPKSPECEILVLCMRKYRIESGPCYVGRYCQSRDKEWNMKYVGRPGRQPLSVYYMNGELYCVFLGGMLKSYNLIEESWKTVVLSLPAPHIHNNWYKYWLVEKERSLMMICHKYKNQSREWLFFSMDWSRLTWVLENNLKNVAFFISDNICYMTALVVDDNSENKDDCFVFRPDLYHGVILTCYSVQKRDDVPPKEYSKLISNSNFIYMTCFVEPPYVGD